MGTTLQGTGLKEFPVFPGIEPEKVFGKKFDTMSIEVHVMKDGKLKKTYAAEDWLAGTIFASIFFVKLIHDLFSSKSYIVFFFCVLNRYIRIFYFLFSAREQILGKPKTKFMNPPSKPGM